ncbi:hypothetical protein [Mycobacterium sp.]|uniref:hypothetical protein n=1 Tax=Mycobacterium sp. TaxID=1785 RepID=UPI003F9CC363
MTHPPTGAGPGDRVPYVAPPPARSTGYQPPPQPPNRPPVQRSMMEQLSTLRPRDQNPLGAPSRSDIEGSLRERGLDVRWEKIPDIYSADLTKFDHIAYG